VLAVEKPTDHLMSRNINVTENPALAPIRKLKILCIGNGGIVYRDNQLWTHRCLGGFLAELGGMVDEVCFCAWLDPNDDPLAQTFLHDIQGVRALALPRFAGTGARKLVNGVLSFVMLAREVFRSQFVYLYWPGGIASMTARLCRVIGKPYGIYFRGEQIPSDPTFESAFRHARFVLTTGQFLNNIAKKYCRDVENVTPMTPLLDRHILPPHPPRQSGPWHLLYVGRLEERKGVQDLLAAVSLLEERGLPFTLTMIGHCYDAPALLRSVSPAVAQRIKLIDAISDFEELIPYFRAADTFVFPSHDEGFPRVLYEAMAFGLPIITTFVGSIPSVMEDRLNCLRIEVRNAKDIAEKLLQLISDEKLQARLTQEGHQCITTLMKTWKRSHSIQVAERLRDLGSPYSS